MLCSNCGQDKKDSRQGQCIACYYYELRTGNKRPAYLYNKPCGNQGRTCVNCHYPSTGKLCIQCANYQSRTGKPRPAKLWGRRHLDYSKLPRWCTVCGKSEIVSNQRCNTCRSYKQKHGKDRPRWLWDPHAPCSNCRRPRVGEPFVKGLCTACDQYKRINGRTRPKYMWGIGNLGWCDCGQPAVVMIEDMPLCQSCADLEMSP